MAKKSTLPALRAALQITQQQLADLAECSIDTIRSLETGRRNLSQAMAIRIARETGVSVEWMLKGDPNSPIKNISGGAFNSSSKTDEGSADFEIDVAVDQLAFVARKVLEAGSASGTFGKRLAFDQLRKALYDVSDKYGIFPLPPFPKPL